MNPLKPLFASAKNTRPTQGAPVCARTPSVTSQSPQQKFSSGVPPTPGTPAQGISAQQPHRRSSALPVPVPVSTRPVCPYCRGPVGKLPRYKAICQRCGQTYYARVRPGESHATLLTARQAAAVDENRVTRPPVQGAIQGVIQGARQGRAQALPASAQMLDAEERYNWFWAFSTAEGQWRQLRRSLNLHAREGNWLLYRNARFEMAELRRRQARLKDAFEIYLEVWYLDLNGPHDCWGMVGARRIYESAPFQRADGLTTPVVARWVHRLAARFNLDKQQVEHIFRDLALRSFRTLNLPLSPAEAWHTLHNELVL